MSNIKGYIHSIESFGTLDGPGIRNVVFFQGCPLRCLYCHNPDTREINANALEYDANGLVKEILKYKNFFDASSGGVTASGGEPALQADFLGAFFKVCKENGIHTALDTSGYIDVQVADKFLPYTDLVLLDLKHLNEKKCIELTGKSNKKFFSFLKLLQQKNISVIIRQVLIEGFTDSSEYIDSLIGFLKQYSCVKKIEVLPFHKMGEPKWESLGLVPPLSHMQPYSKANAYEIQCKIQEALKC